MQASLCCRAQTDHPLSIRLQRTHHSSQRRTAVYATRAIGTVFGPLYNSFAKFLKRLVDDGTDCVGLEQREQESQEKKRKEG